MKKVISFMLIFSMLVLALPAQAARGVSNFWIECETDARVVSGDWAPMQDSNASGGGSLLLNSRDAKPHEVEVRFNITDPDEYDIFLLAMPSNMGWSSALLWNIDGDEYALDNAQPAQYPYVCGGMLPGPVGWRKLATRTFDKGSHAVNLMVEALRPASIECLMVLDTVVVVPSSWKYVPIDLDMRPFDIESLKMSFAGGAVPEEPLQKDSTFTVMVENKLNKKCDGNPKLFAELTSKDGRVDKKVITSAVPINDWDTGDIYRNTFELYVPFNLPDGEYEVRCGIENGTYENGEASALVGTVTIGKGESPKKEAYTAIVSGEALSGTIEKGKSITAEFAVSVSPGLDFDTTPYIGLWKDGLLYGVLETKEKVIADGQKHIYTFKYDEDIPDGVYSARVGIHYIKTNGASAKTVSLSGANAQESKYHKPMSHGFYEAKRDGKEVFWYINQAGATYFNGEPYIPMGGMFCPHYLTYYNEDDPEGNKQRWQNDMNDLAVLREAGINDLYINNINLDPNVIPKWVYQGFLDHLEETGWRYGIQLGTMNPERYTTTTYPSAMEKAFKVTGVAKSGPVSVICEKGQIPEVKECIDATYLAVNDATGEPVDSGKATLKFDSTGNFIFGADVKVADGQKHTIYFVPRTIGHVHASIDFIDDKHIPLNALDTFAKSFESGVNMRMFVDITANEMGVYNNGERVRYSSEKFNSAFAQQLKAKYGTVAALNAAWAVEGSIGSFEEASRLVPILTTPNDGGKTSYMYYTDMDTGKYYKMDSHNSVAWNDYLVVRDDLFLDMNNEAADALKKYVDVPVIYKHCSVQRQYFINDQLKGGMDGVGSEAYGVAHTVDTTAGITVSHSVQFARTAWMVITETNTEEDVYKKYNGGEADWGYPDKDTFFRHFKGMMDAGAKGFYNFLLTNRYDLGGVLGAAYGHINNPECTDWLVEYINTYGTEAEIEKITSQRYQNDTYYYFPPGRNWWFAYNERGVAQLEDDSLGIMRLKTEGGNHILPTNDVNIKTDILFVDLQNGPNSIIYADQVAEAIASGDKKVVVLGFREDLGNVPAVDKYYTAEKVAVNENVSVQVLAPSASGQVLKTTADGKPWAIKEGNLYIIASNDLMDTSGEFITLKHIEELGITSGKIEQTAAPAGFADMVGHWAQETVEKMRAQGIASGMGNNMFMPDKSITRAEFVALATRIRAYEKEGVLPEKIPQDKWYAGAFAIANANGLLRDEFIENPEVDITREEMAWIAAAVIGESDGAELGFADAGDIADIYKNAVGIVLKNGVMQGMPGNRFAPGETATRAQAIVVISGLLNTIL